MAVTASRPLDLTATLSAAWRSGFLVKSNFAREHAQAVAAAACLALITTESLPHSNTFGRTWLITTKGLKRLSKSS